MSNILCKFLGHKWFGAYYDREIGCYFSNCKRKGCNASEYIT